MKLLITGGSGFIGTNLMTHCLQQGITVLNVDWNPPLNRDHTPYWVGCDILDFGQLKGIFADFGPTHVVHLAARTDTAELEDMSAYLQNTQGTRHVLECAKATRSLQRLVVTSTQFVCKAGFEPEHDEDYNPVNLYGVTKILTEQFTRSAGLTCSWTIIRPTTIWGPWSLRYRDVMLKVLQKGLYFHPSKTDVVRSYGYVKNVVFQIMQILTVEAGKINGQTFYVGDEPLNLKSWADTVSEVLVGKKVRVIPAALVGFLARIGDVVTALGLRFPITSGRYKSMTTDYVTPMDQTIRVLGRAPYSVRQGVEEMCQWYQTVSSRVATPPPDLPRQSYNYQVHNTAREYAYRPEAIQSMP